MNEWTVVGVLVTIITIIASVTAPIVKLNSTIASLAVKIEMFGKDIEKLEAGEKTRDDINRLEHSDLYNKANAHDSKLENHETRINHLEGTK